MSPDLSSNFFLFARPSFLPLYALLWLNLTLVLPSIISKGTLLSALFPEGHTRTLPSSFRCPPSICWHFAFLSRTRLNQLCPLCTFYITWVIPLRCSTVLASWWDLNFCIQTMLPLIGFLLIPLLPPTYSFPSCRRYYSRALLALFRRTY